jgi:hypothetical protein
MKAITSALLWFGTASALLAFEPQRIVTAHGTDFSRVESLLKDGWTVAAQSSTPTSARTANYSATYSLEPIHVFTLNPPTLEVKRGIAEAKAAEFAKRRAEYLAKKNATQPEASK